jgi:hypothetical protein
MKKTVALECKHSGAGCRLRLSEPRSKRLGYTQCYPLLKAKTCKEPAYLTLIYIIHEKDQP